MTKADELVKLDALRKAGVLTEEEFVAEKAKLLAAVLPPTASSSPPQPSRDAVPPPSLTIPTEQNFGDTAVLTTENPHSNKNLLVVIGITVVVIVAAVGAFFLVKGSSGRNRADNITAAESNLQTAFTGAKTYFESANQTYTGVLNGTSVSNINELDTGLTFVPGSKASTDADTVSVSQSGGEVLVLTAYASAAGSCFGIVDITGEDGLPAWLTGTGITVGTYYFQIHQASAGNCSSTAATTSGATLYTNGWQ